MADSKWWTRSWNPVIGCSPASPGCANCYAARLASTRLAHLPAYGGLAVASRAVGGSPGYGENATCAPYWTGEVRPNDRALRAGPPRMKQGILFVCDMGDLFHRDVPDGLINQVLLALPPAPVKSMLLTKRPARMVQMVRAALDHVPLAAELWCGVTAEDQQHWDARAPYLAQLPPSVHRFVSCEPLLEEIEMRCPRCGGDVNDHCAPDGGGCSGDFPEWIIVGGESGPGARFCDLLHVEPIVRDCARAGVKCFVKQLGSNVVEGLRPVWTPHSRRGADMQDWPTELRVRDLP